ncbi:MAG TPA: FAD-binding oxidoreductase [Ktedonobacteraceae bacterium]
MKEMNRREFLALGMLGALPSILMACQSGTPNVVNPTATPRSTPIKQPSPTSADWSVLARSLEGTLIRPDSPQYATARQLFDPSFDNVLPMAIAYCASAVDVQTCLAFVRRFSLPFVPRAGGHSYAGYSTTTGLVLDVTRMNGVTVDAGSGTAVVGAGARLIDVYAALAQHGLALPAGSCATVGIAGLTLGGGVGVLGRKFGLTCDNLLSAQVVVANSNILTCDASHNPDLFWALCGGGGGNFGVATSFSFRTYQVGALSLFTLNWPWGSAADVFDAWQNWAPQAPDELWSNCLLLATNNKSSDPIVRVNGVYAGNVGPLDSLLQQLTSQISAAPASRYVSSSGLLESMMIEAGCYGMTVNECHLPSQDPHGQLLRVTSGAKSDYFTNLVSRQGIDMLVSAIAGRQASSTLGEGGIGFDAYGGAINRVLPDATAFVHRNALFSAQYSANWNTSDPNSVIAANYTWLEDTWQTMRQYASGAAYQNYIDPNLLDWQHAYYGANLLRLQRIKAIYDPGNLFRFDQSIPPAT